MKIVSIIFFTHLLWSPKMKWKDEFWLNVNLGVNLKNILLLVCEEWHKESRQRTRRMRTSFAHMLTQLHGRYSPCPALTRFPMRVCVSRVVKREILYTYTLTHAHLVPALAPACRHLWYEREHRYVYFMLSTLVAPSSCTTTKLQWVARWHWNEWFVRVIQVTFNYILFYNNV